MMPEMDGIEACEKIRETPILEETLVLLLTARAEEYSELAGFTAGADDYITKPIKPKLLISRVKAILKRKRRKESVKKITLGEILIDKEKHQLTYSGKSVSLARKEFNLLFLWP